MMELSALPAAPLDFSLSVRGAGIQQTTPEQLQQPSQHLQQSTAALIKLETNAIENRRSPSGPRQSAASAFRIVTPKGKLDGKFEFLIFYIHINLFMNYLLQSLT